MVLNTASNRKKMQQAVDRAFKDLDDEEWVSAEIDAYTKKWLYVLTIKDNQDPNKVFRNGRWKGSYQNRRWNFDLALYN